MGKILGACFLVDIIIAIILHFARSADRANHCATAKVTTIAFDIVKESTGGSAGRQLSLRLLTKNYVLVFMRLWSKTVKITRFRYMSL
jgi:hypothetical protein